VVLAATGQDELEDARSRGLVVAADGWVALDELATAEAAVADELVGLAAEERLAVVLGEVPAGADVYLVPDVHRCSLEEVATLLQAAPDDARVVVSGDPDALAGSAPGAVLRDLLAADLAPVRDLRPSSADTALERLLAAVRSGVLPAPDPQDRSVVVVPCPDDEVLLTRVVQLVTDSIPRVFGVQPADVLVLTPLVGGTAGVTALSALLAETGAMVSTVHGAAGRRAPAVVGCFPGQAAGVLTRALVHDVACAASQHLSVVTAAGDALPQSVVGDPGPGRTTRLAFLLKAGAAELA
jgi:hypothetical protein